ncbi:redoxin domain-containing protein [Aneurinibacillus aneurinilyticus]|jgi:peroxiredoxin|uniref:Redoxin domain-containing protein n=2 Tax=Aneurinibacillus aneurinilyticus TaxID=1391 RepID=A0A848CLS4_ANEAE|nr:redoxin domain-containing protein [Aneurinibacillus aneurinilyticus]ERI10052.1 putative thiol-disulfide oxidoreductase ResA [Aneurinibacillus aneurinilyticus ATCC 12856]MCI1693038.1 redoxin domain-containing protein [Aneurinibacillus aneurinilyticus]MED0669935.1 redoxin domain-containing protein [Aneurinibacillus aneurinilyticus]MED0708103.1 redoxin domain-containing protein [Aneurinibacillus aneurinilyticus]MED0726023.1 redoxin domain-containing protein [Aneurinibacillus aneurinilyticus]
MKTRKITRLFVLAVIVLAVGWTFYTAYFKDKTTVQVGKPVPDFVAQQIGGEKVQLSQLKGKAVVLNFWGTYCPPCREEMADLNRASKEFANKDVVILAINVGESEIPIQSFARQYKLDALPLLMDPARAITRKYQIGQMPSTFFVRADGTLYKHIVGGPMSYKTIQDNMQQIVP